MNLVPCVVTPQEKAALWGRYVEDCQSPTAAATDDEQETMPRDAGAGEV